jgi:hypothetical protein
MTTRKICTACGKKLSAASFNRSARSADGLARTCRACVNSRRRQDERSSGRDRSSTVLAQALRRGDVKTLRKLIRAGVSPHWSWVCETMREGHISLAQMLLESGVKPNIFTMAAMGDAKGLTRRLARVPADARLTAGMDPASDRVTPLHVACASDWRSHGHVLMRTQVRVAQALSEHGADLHAAARYRGIRDATPLFCASWTSGNAELVSWLLHHGACADVAYLMAALGHLQRHGRGAYDVAEAILAWGVKVDGETRNARTPLQAFANQGDHRAVAWLLAHGANVHARGPGGRTAAHFAAERNTSPKTLSLLVEHGADLSAQDNDGLTPGEIAKLHEKPRLVTWIAQRVRGMRQRSSRTPK